jgi:glycosyltransferase involved in cell wall biosynthesis
LFKTTLASCALLVGDSIACMGNNPHILFLIRSLERGGAERQLVMLASGLRRQGWLVTVACFYAGGPFQRDLEHAGVHVINLAKRGRWDMFGFLWRLMRMFRKTRPDIVHGYLPVSNILSLLVRLSRPSSLVVWGVRASNVDFSRYDWLSRVIFWLQCRLARYADLSIVNSSAGMEHHVVRGFPQGAMRVIQNGIDTSHFRFDPAGRERMRHAWGVPQSAVLVGLVGRVDPMKDHPTFLRAAARLILTDPRWWFVCVGDGAPEDMARLSKQATELGLEQRLIWAGACDNMSAAYSAFDMAASSSCGEGFPNVVAEAMACGRPCVVTDVGDSARIVGEFGVVVPPRDAAALSDGICRLHARLERNCTALTQQVREHVIKSFGQQALVNATVEYLWNSTGLGDHLANAIRPRDDI